MDAKAKAEKDKVTQETIAKACDLDQGSVSRILNKDTRDSFAEETVRQVFKVAREIGYLHPALVTTNRRESVRKKTSLEGKVSIIIGTNTVYDSGLVAIDEVSMSGMLLHEFRTEKNSLPMDRFKLDVEVTGPKLKGVKCRCKLVRFSDNENEFALAVKFESMDEASKEKLLKFVR